MSESATSRSPTPKVSAFLFMRYAFFMVAGKLIKIFILALVLNFIWEELHSRFYIQYQGEPITHAILARAAFFDALIILIGAVFLLFLPPFLGRIWLVLTGLLMFAIGLEIFALATGRWQYNQSMPMIPVLGIGLTPTIQLALLGFLSYSIFAVTGKGRR
ncbi:MAG: Membrane protein [Parcubacteria group bacterium GW2011_GWA1_47_9]|nr:MAG: Membrane protein [Parcubacteria group bacterium GW2011_GWA1_47_9]